MKSSMTRNDIKRYDFISYEDALPSGRQVWPYIQVSMISAYGDEANYKKAMESGAKEFYTKPVNFENLKKEIAEIEKSNS